MHLPRRHRHETQRLHGCAADYVRWERRPAPRAKISAKTGGKPFGTRSFQAEHRADAGTDASDESRSERWAAAASGGRPVPAASAGASGGTRTTAAGTASGGSAAARRDPAEGPTTGRTAGVGWQPS